MSRVSEFLFVLPMTVSIFVLVVKVLAIIEKIALPLRDTLLTDKLTQLDLGFFLQLDYHPRRGVLLLLRKGSILFWGLPHSDSLYYHAQ